MRYKLRDDVGRLEKYSPGQGIDEKDVPRYVNNYARLIEEVPEGEEAGDAEAPGRRVPIAFVIDPDEDGDSE